MSTSMISLFKTNRNVKTINVKLSGEQIKYLPKTIEDGTKINGLGTAVKELIVDDKIRGIKFKSFAYPDEFIPHGSVNELEDLYNMSTKKIASEINKECEVYKKNK